MGRFLRGFVHAGRGLAAAWRGELNLKVMLGITVAACALGWWRGIGPLDWAVVAVCAGLVLGLEIINTAAERLLDFVHPDRHEEVGRIKDMLAGAVLVASVAAAVAGVLVVLL